MTINRSFQQYTVAAENLLPIVNKYYGNGGTLRTQKLLKAQGHTVHSNERLDFLKGFCIFKVPLLP